MMPITARAVYIKAEARDNPRSMQRIARMLPFIRCVSEPRTIDDAGLQRVIIDEELNAMPLHGMHGAAIEPVVIFNEFLPTHSPDVRAERARRYPELFKHWLQLYAGYGGWDWRSMGDEDYRRTTGLVCQPAYAMHSFWGCHFRCAYCSLGHVASIYANLEDWIEHIRQGLAHPAKAPGQTLFQWDNGTDVVCWEPEYGGTKMLVDLFATQPGKHLELYVGKSDHVDYLLNYDHRGHTICCWSFGGVTQCSRLEPRSAGMEARLASARKCQEAGYGVRIRFSPMVPVVGWRNEIRHMIRRMFDEITPDLITMEPLRYCSRQALLDNFEPGLLDPEFMQAMAGIPEEADWQTKTEFPDDCRIAMYRCVLDEVARISPGTPIALCREQRRVWDALSVELARMGQRPDDYVCNCGPTSAGTDARLRRTLAPP